MKRDVTQAYISPEAKISNQGKLTSVRAAMQTIMTTQGVQKVPGLVIDFKANEEGHKDQRLNVMVLQGEMIPNIIGNVLALIFDEETIEDCMNYIHAKAAEVVNDGKDHTPAVVPQDAEIKEEDDPNVR